MGGNSLKRQGGDFVWRSGYSTEADGGDITWGAGMSVEANGGDIKMTAGDSGPPACWSWRRPGGEWRAL